MTDLQKILKAKTPLTLSGVPAGFQPWLLADIARAAGAANGRAVFIASDEQLMRAVADTAHYFAPEIEIIEIPAWDCLPYDRLSPHPDIVAERLEPLARLATPKKPGAPARVILASVGAVLQKVPPRKLYAEAAKVLRKGESIDIAALTRYLGENGYGRADTVMEPGEYAVRGGLYLVWGHPLPVSAAHLTRTARRDVAQAEEADSSAEADGAVGPSWRRPAHPPPKGGSRDKRLESSPPAWGL